MFCFVFSLAHTKAPPTARSPVGRCPLYLRAVFSPNPVPGLSALAQAGLVLREGKGVVEFVAEKILKEFGVVRWEFFLHGIFSGCLEGLEIP